MAFRISIWIVLIGVTLSGLPLQLLLPESASQSLEMQDKSKKEEKEELEKEETKILTRHLLVDQDVSGNQSRTVQFSESMPPAIHEEPQTPPPECPTS